MSQQQFSTNQDIVDVINDVIVQNDLNIDAEVTYDAGSDVGDGYSSKTVAVRVQDGDKSLDLFLKTPIQNASTDKDDAQLFASEIYFYTVIYPAFEKFLLKRGLPNGFPHIPKCYAVGKKEGREVIALDDLKKKNFNMFYRTRAMNHAHLVLVLQTLAKFHAISFAMKNQDKEKFDKLVHEAADQLDGGRVHAQGFGIFVENVINEFVEKLDPVQDKRLLDGCGNLAYNLILKDGKHSSEHAVISHGDCWSNNMMFLYKTEQFYSPIDMVIYDWQLVRLSSPVYDLSYFFYTMGTKENLPKLHEYLKIYHDQLSKSIKELGSDPKELYPYSTFLEEWQKYGKNGAAVAFIIVPAMYFSPQQSREFSEMLRNSRNSIEKMKTARLPKTSNEEEPLRRLKDIMLHLIDEKLL